MITKLRGVWKDFRRGCMLWAFSLIISAFAVEAYFAYGEGIHSCGWDEFWHLCAAGLFAVVTLVFLFIQGHDRK